MNIQEKEEFHFKLQAMIMMNPEQEIRFRLLKQEDKVIYIVEKEGFESAITSSDIEPEGFYVVFSRRVFDLPQNLKDCCREELN